MPDRCVSCATAPSGSAISCEMRCATKCSDHARGVKYALMPRSHACCMVSRKRLRSFLTAIGLYVGAALLIGYFAINAYTGNHGLRARQDIDQQIAEMTIERDRLKLERADWQRRVA